MCSECPICNKDITGDNAALNRHIDECLNHSTIEEMSSLDTSNSSSNTSALMLSNERVQPAARLEEAMQLEHILLYFCTAKLLHPQDLRTQSHPKKVGGKIVRKASSKKAKPQLQPQLNHSTLSSLKNKTEIIIMDNDMSGQGEGERLKMI